MDIEATKAKLRKLSDEDFKKLEQLVEWEGDRREDRKIRVMSNRTHTGREQAQALSTFFANAASQH